MKKTLKILMAIILFAVVLTIATSVNAAAEDYTTSSKAFTDLLDDDDNTKIKASTTINSLIVDNTVTIDLNNNAVAAKIEVLGTGNLTLKNTDTTGVAVKAIEVKEGGKISLDGTNITVTDGITSKGSVSVTKAPTAKKVTIVNDKGTVSISDDVAVASLTTNTDVTINKAAVEAVVVSDNAATVVIKNNTATTLPSTVTGSESEIVLVNAKGVTKYQIFTSYKNLDLTTKFIDKEGKESTADKKGKYAIVNEKLSYKGLELAMTDTKIKYVAAVEPIAPDYIAVSATATATAANYPDRTFYELEVKQDLGDKSFNIVPSYDNNEIAVVKIPTTVSNEEPNQPEQPENPADTNKPADDNKGDLDESPKTGDHIIPAATLLAVVVVANVVYFAKSKNN